MLEPDTRVMKKEAAFMYGNNIRLSDSVACYNACNGRHQSRFEKVLKAWYLVWDRDVSQSHKELYYSMILKCLAWIKEKARDQYEEVKPVVILNKYGPAAIRYPGRISHMIETIRSRVE